MKRQGHLWLSTVGLFLLCILIPFSLFLRDFSSPADEVSYADAIIILTGGMGRSEEGLSLFREGKGGYLIISGVEGSSRLAEIFPGRDLGAMVDTTRIVLDMESRSTVDNAVNVKRIVEDKGFKSLILVTSNYHMKRAFTIFRKAIREDVKIYRHPVKGPNFRDEWWRDLKSVKLILSEFFKYCGFQAWQRWVEF